jgi:selenocysteine lyase/cysteine desulfurase
VGAHARICGLTADGRVDVDQFAALVGAIRQSAAFSRVSNALGSINRWRLTA